MSSVQSSADRAHVRWSVKARLDSAAAGIKMEALEAVEVIEKPEKGRRFLRLVWNRH